MSGGAYDYLCFKDAADILRERKELSGMLTRLESLPYASEAAQKTREVLESVDALNAAVDELRGVWQAVEWWESGDRSEDAVKDAVKELEK